MERCFRGIAILHAEAMKDFASICGLREMNGTGWIGTINIESKESFDETEILDHVGFGKLRLKIVNAFGSVRKNKEIIYINCYNSNIFAVLFDENSFVSVGLSVSMRC